MHVETLAHMIETFGHKVRNVLVLTKSIDFGLGLSAICWC
jgi:hypothetical protein